MEKRVVSTLAAAAAAGFLSLIAAQGKTTASYLNTLGPAFYSTTENATSPAFRDTMIELAEARMAQPGHTHMLIMDDAVTIHGVTRRIRWQTGKPQHPSPEIAARKDCEPASVYLVMWDGLPFGKLTREIGPQACRPVGHNGVPAQSAQKKAAPKGAAL